MKKQTSTAHNLGVDKEVNSLTSSDLFTALPQIDQDLLHLFLEKRLTQAEIADLYGVTQSNICMHIKKAIERLKYISRMKTVDYDLLKKLLTKKDYFIIKTFLRLTSQSWVAVYLNHHLNLVGKERLSQSKVYYRIQRILSTLENYHKKNKNKKIARAINEIKNTNHNVSILKFCPKKEKYAQCISDPV